MMNILAGQVCLDIYKNKGKNLVVPGGGILHNAYHLQCLDYDPLLITRIGDNNSSEFLDFFSLNNITVARDSLIQQGRSASIEIEVKESREAEISNLIKGIWENFSFTEKEESIIAKSNHFHTVLVEEILLEFERLCLEKVLEKPLVSADLLDLRYISIDKLAYYLKFLDIAFIGWKDNKTEALIKAVKQIKNQIKTLVIITMGDREILVLDPRSKRFQCQFSEVNRVTVKENTNGCGDAFISYFLAEYWKSKDLERAIAQGKIGGAKAAAWRFALPDSAYGQY